MRKLCGLLVLLVGTAVQAEPPVRVDGNGDLLPPGARTRLGSLRWRPGRATWLEYNKDGQSIFTAFLTSSHGMYRGAAQNEIRQWDLHSGKEVRRYRIPCEDDWKLIADVNLRRHLVAFYKANCLDVWDMEGGKTVSSIKSGHDFYEATLSPSGKLLAAWNRREASVYIWDVAKAQVVQRLRSGLKEDHSGLDAYRHGLLFSPDESRLVVLIGSNNLRIWDVAGKEILNRTEKDGHINTAAFAPDGRLLAWSTDKYIHLWDVEGNRERRRWTDAEGKFAGLAFSPDGKTLASGEQLRLWDVGDGKLLRRLPCTPPCSVRHMTFSPDGKELAGIDGASVRRWDVASGTERTLSNLPTQEVSNVLFISGDEKLVTSQRRGASFWDTGTGKHLRFDPESQGDLALAPDGRIGAFRASDRRTVVCRDFAARRKLHELRHDKDVVFFAVSADSATVVVVTEDEQAHLWSTATGKKLRSFALPRDDKIIHASIRTEMATFEDKYVFSPDGRYAAYSSWSRQTFPNPWRMAPAALAVWELSSGKRLPTLQIPGEQAILAASAFSSDGRTLAVTVKQERRKNKEGGQTWPSQFYLFETATGQERVRILGTDEGAMGCGLVATNGRYLAFAEGSGYKRYPLFVWDAVTDRPLGTFHPTHNVRCLAFSRDGRTLASGLGDSTVLLWKVSEPAREEPKLSAGELEEAWSALVGDDARKAYRAIHRLAAAPQQSIPFLRDHLKPAATVDAKRIERLIADLDDDAFAVRERASRELKQIGSPVAPALRRVLAKRPTLEMRRRIEQLLEPFDRGRCTPDELRSLRAVEAVEHMATPEVRQMLASWAEGAPDAVLTHEARLSLQRLRGCK
jgi:WD40 repeat protein